MPSLIGMRSGESWQKTWGELVRKVDELEKFGTSWSENWGELTNNIWQADSRSGASL